MAVSSSIVFSKNYAIPIADQPTNKLHSFVRCQDLMALTIDRMTSLWNILTSKKLWSVQQSSAIPPKLLLDKTGLVVQIYNFECSVLSEGKVKGRIIPNGKFTDFKLLNGELYGFGSEDASPCICRWKMDGVLIQKLMVHSLNGCTQGLFYECDERYFVICGNEIRANLEASSSCFVSDRRSPRVLERFLNLKNIGSISVLGEQLILGVHQKVPIRSVSASIGVHKNAEIIIMDLMTGQFTHTLTTEGLYSSIVHTFGFQTKLFFVSVEGRSNEMEMVKEVLDYKAQSRLVTLEKPKGVFEEIPVVASICNQLNLTCTAKLSSLDLTNGEIGTITTLGLSSNFVSSIWQNSYNLCYRAHDHAATGKSQVGRLAVNLGTNEVQVGDVYAANEVTELSFEGGISVLKQLDSTGMFATIKDYTDNVQ